VAVSGKPVEGVPLPEELAVGAVGGFAVVAGGRVPALVDGSGPLEEA
jgi:hypothetical protein